MKRIPDPDQTPAGPAYQGRLLARPADEVVDQGAGFDLGTLMSRRGMLALFGVGAGALTLAACGSDGAPASPSTSGASSSGSTASGEIPQETNGPYPADGSNGVNVLQQSGIVRQDIRSSLGSQALVDGVTLTFTFTLTDIAQGGVPFAGAAVYLWQCDAQGRYSMYSEGVEDESFLRGIQVADAQGMATFTTIVPGCYAGRWPHLHFEVYPDAASATSSGNAIATSQVAFPKDMVTTVYAESTYPGSASNLGQVSLETDNVFSDGYALELGTFAGDPAAGYTGGLTVAIDTTTTPTAGGAAPPPGP